MNITELAQRITDQVGEYKDPSNVAKDLRVLYGTALDAAEVPVSVARRYIAEGYDRIYNKDAK